MLVNGDEDGQMVLDLSVWGKAECLAPAVRPCKTRSSVAVLAGLCGKVKLLIHEGKQLVPT